MNVPASPTLAVPFVRYAIEVATVVDHSSKSMKWSSAVSPYIAVGRVSIDDRIIVDGHVELILTDWCTLSAAKGIQVTEGNSLTITTPSGSAGNGKLIATGYSTDVGNSYAGIGSGKYVRSGDITVIGGMVTAIGGDCAAGIGGGLSGACGNIMIVGGTITATGGEKAAGIGGGDDGAVGNITMTGGTITATGGEKAAGIGGCLYGGCGNITISGGIVTATGGVGGAGIGGGEMGDGGTITIHGGKVTAATDRGDGIGCGLIAIGHSTLSSGADGNAWISSSSVGACCGCFTSGVLFKDVSGTVHGAPAIDMDVEIPAGKTLTVPHGSALIVRESCKMTNSGRIINNGVVSLPDGTDIKALGMTGRGSVVMDGKTYDNEGCEVSPPEP